MPRTRTTLSLLVSHSRPATLRDVARHAGVSVATVSLALRGSPRISEETVARVRQSAQELAYAPNPLVAALMAQMRGVRETDDVEVLAVVWATTHRPPPSNTIYVEEMLAGARERAAVLGHRVEVFNADPDDLGDKRLDSILYNRGIRGVILPPISRANRRLEMDWSRYSGVALGYSMQEPALHRVCPDQFQGMILAIEQLRGRGYRRIGLFIDEDTDVRVRHKFTAAMAWHNLEVRSQERVPLLLTPRLDAESFQHWLREYQPEVVLSSSQVAMNWMREAGLRIPEDVGFAHVNWTERGEPCAGIDQRPRLLGWAAVDAVVAQLHNNEHGVPSVPRTISIDGVWMDGCTIRDRPPT